MVQFTQLDADILLKNESFIGKNSRAYIMPNERSVNIDTFADLLLAKSYFSQ